MFDTKLSSDQKKILLIAILVLIALLVLWFFIYLPKKAEKNRLQSELEAVNYKIRQMQAVIGFKEGEVGRGLAELKQHLGRLDEKFPKQKDISRLVKQIQNEARRNKVEIKAIEFQQHEPYRGPDGTIINIEGCVCSRLPITLRIEASYKDFGEYLFTLKEKLSAFFTVERLGIRKGQEGADKLGIELVINIYSLT